MATATLKEAHKVLGGRLIADTYPFYTEDSQLWIKLLTEASQCSISFYAVLVKLRAIGTKLESNAKFGYVIVPILRSESTDNWGFPSLEVWNEEKKALLPHKETLLRLLKELK